MFIIGQKVKCNNNKPLSGNDESPDLEIGKEYIIKNIILDKQGNQHLDVGLKSHLNYIRSYETKEELPNGKTIHWCHPSRFNII
jgi:LEA14-like dessication related protein